MAGVMPLGQSVGMKTLTIACTALLLLTACGTSNSGQEAATGFTAAPSATSTAASQTPAQSSVPTRSPTLSVQATSDGAECGDPSSYERTAKCLHEAFRDQDRQAASRYATPDAVEAMFALGGYPTDDQWQFDGCDSGRETSPSSGVACHYLIPGEVHPVYVEMVMRDDYVVEQVRSIG